MLFDTLIAPILLYGSEEWRFENCDITEAYHFKFCKMMLHFKPSTPTVMVYGELGRFPMQIFNQSRMINFWSKVVWYVVKTTNCLTDYSKFCII